MQRHYQAWTYPEIEKLKEMVRDGTRDRVMADLLGRSINSIRGKRWELGIGSAPRPWTADERRQVTAAWRAGYSAEVISEHLLRRSRSPQAIRDAMKHRGIAHGRGRGAIRVPPGDPTAPHASWDEVIE